MTLVEEDSKLDELVSWLIITIVEEDGPLLGTKEGVKGASCPFGLAWKYPGQVDTIHCQLSYIAIRTISVLT